MNAESAHATPEGDEYVAECFWPGVSLADVDDRDRRARAVTRRSRRRGIPVRYLGSILMPDDEVVLFEFRAESADVVAETSGRAGIPFQRIVPTVRRPPER